MHTENHVLIEFFDVTAPMGKLFAFHVEPLCLAHRLSATFSRSNTVVFEGTGATVITVYISTAVVPLHKIEGFP